MTSEPLQDRSHAVDPPLGVTRIRQIAPSVGVLAVAFAVGCAFVALSGGNPFHAGAVLLYGALGTSGNIAGVIVKSVPLILTGLSVAVAFRVGLFNIGGEGQLYAGALVSAALGATDLGLPSFIHLPAVLLAALAAGTVWGVIPGWLKARRGVHEVINTIMLNYIAIQTVDYLVSGPLNAGGYATRTHPIVPAATMPELWSVEPVPVSWGVVVALAACAATAWWLFNTAGGVEFRAVGLNPKASRAVGIADTRKMILGMGLAGGLAGLAGGLEVVGLHHTLYAQFSPGYGFDGIAVALLAQSHPVAIIPVAVLFGALRTADRWLQLVAGVPRDIVIIIQGVAVLGVGLQTALTRRAPAPHGPPVQPATAS